MYARKQDAWIQEYEMLPLSIENEVGRALRPLGRFRYELTNYFELTG
jgi:hypothetical protein